MKKAIRKWCAWIAVGCFSGLLLFSFVKDTLSGINTGRNITTVVNGNGNPSTPPQTSVKKTEVVQQPKKAGEKKRVAVVPGGSEAEYKPEEGKYIDGFISADLKPFTVEVNGKRVEIDPGTAKGRIEFGFISSLVFINKGTNERSFFVRMYDIP